MADKFELNDEELHQVNGGEAEPVSPVQEDIPGNTAGYKCGKCNRSFTTENQRNFHQLFCRGN